MAKVPVAGQVKTRLSPPLSATQATELARAFLIDTWERLQQLVAAQVVLCHAGDARLLPPSMELADHQLWPQPGGDLGARMEHALRRGLARAARVVLIGSDTPTLPTVALTRALAALESADAVLGPAVDGGYYLLGARRLSPGLLAGLPWSSPRTLRATYRRLRQRGYRVALLPTWFDVDDARSLSWLRALLAHRLARAAATEVALAGI